MDFFSTKSHYIIMEANTITLNFFIYKKSKTQNNIKKKKSEQKSRLVCCSSQ